MLCVLQRLHGTDPPPADAAEHFRLLAFAAARLDRQPEVKDAVARWAAAVPGLRLQRDAVPPVIWRAWLDVRLHHARSSLDLQPRAGSDAVALPSPFTASHLAHLPPPSRSDRDDSGDARFGIDLVAASASGGFGEVFGAEVDLGLCLGRAEGGDERRCWLGVGLLGRGLFLTGDTSASGVLAAFAVQATLRPLAGLPNLEASLDLGGGMLQLSTALPDLAAGETSSAAGTVPVGGAAFRYVSAPAGAVSLRLGARVVVVAGDPHTFGYAGLTVGVAFTPLPRRRKPQHHGAEAEKR